jgi:hypothetical protein
MRFGTMLHIIVTQQKIHQPCIRFVLNLGLMKVVEGLVHLLYRTKWGPFRAVTPSSAGSNKLGCRRTICSGPRI